MVKNGCMWCCMCVHALKKCVCGLVQRFDLIQSRLCWESPSFLCMCVHPSYQHIFGNFVPSCPFLLRFKECMIVCARVCVCVCVLCVQMWFRCTLVCRVYSAVGEVKSLVIPPPPAVCSSCWKWFQRESEGSILHIKTTSNGAEPPPSRATEFNE